MFAALLLVVAASLTSGLILSRDRMTDVLRQALVPEQLSSDRTKADWVEDWVECSLLTTEFVRHDNIFLDAIDTRWVRPTQHTCDELKALLEGPPYAIQLAPPTSYPNYPFGARHLEAIALSVISFPTAQKLCLFLSYASIVALLLGGWRNTPRQAAMVLLPISVFLAFAFELHRYGNNVMWAPAFFIGFFILAAFLAAPATFGDRSSRLGLFCFLALILTYLDTMQGSLPVLLSLAIVLNHFFYVARARYESSGAYWRAAASEGLSITACFLLCFAAFTVIRLIILDQAGVLGSTPVFDVFVRQLGGRMGDAVPGVGTIGLPDVVQKLWSERSQMTGNELATFVLIASGLAWVVSGVLLATAFIRFGKNALFIAADVVVLLVAALGILLWYVLFPNHSYVHAWFMIRMMALPAAYGFVGAIVMMQGLVAGSRDERRVTAPSRKAVPA